MLRLPTHLTTKNSRLVLQLHRFGTFLIGVLLLFGWGAKITSGQSLSLAEIRAQLTENPPAGGDPVVRENAILELDEHLLAAGSESNPSVADFYNNAMYRLAYETALPVPTGARIWQMYNHGYIVKTPSSMFAFDLIDGLGGAIWDYRLPDEVLQRLDVFLVSHEHRDHVGRLGDVIGLQVPVYTTSSVLPSGSFPLGSEVVVGPLTIRAKKGLHDPVDNYIFTVTTTEGLTVMHTGDTQHSRYLPADVQPDVLLINAWMNESGSRSATVGVRNGVRRVAPGLTIPGHIQELSHAYNPSDSATRIPYEWPLAVDDEPIPGRLAVMAWGEHYDLNVDITSTVHVSPASIYRLFDDADDGFDSQGDRVSNSLGRTEISLGEIDTEGVNSMARLMVKFALPGAPSDRAELRRALLRLHLEAVDGLPSGPVSLAHSASDNEVLNPPPDAYHDDAYSDTSLRLATPDAAGGLYYELDVTDLVRTDYAGDGVTPLSAFRLDMEGAAFLEDNLSNRYRFTTTGAEQNHPELILVFTPEPATDLLAALGLLAFFVRRVLGALA